MNAECRNEAEIRRRRAECRSHGRETVPQLAIK